jgi:hypothetical protein
MDDTAAPQAAGEGEGTFWKELYLLRFDWGSAYEIEPGGEQWTARARRRDGLGDWMEGTPDEVQRLIAADYLARPVSRDIAP